MAFPTDPTNPAGASASALANARLTPEDAERLAATFRPSWELEDAPVSVVSALVDSDLRAMKPGRTAADVRGAVHALNGTHAPAPATILREEPNSVIIDGGGDVASAAAPAAPDMPRTAPASGAAAPQAQMPQQRTLVMAAQRTLVMPNAPTLVRPSGRRSMPSVDLSGVDFGKRAKLALWLGLCAAALLLLGVSVWFASTSAQQKERTIPVPPAETAEATGQSRIPPPPPPPPVETAAAQPVQSAPTVQAAQPTAAASPTPAPTAVAPATPQPTTVVAVAPPTPAPPPPRAVVPTAPRAPVWTPPPPAAKPPPPRPVKAGPTIVHDVPF